jgi:hypothetical protein
MRLSVLLLVRDWPDRQKFVPKGDFTQLAAN